jgi:succinate dehydrogenase/fumarate reductase cytochrome b subunit (b558 family)
VVPDHNVFHCFAFEPSDGGVEHGAAPGGARVRQPLELVVDGRTGTLHPTNYAPFQDGNIYSNLVGDFRNWFIALIYVLAVSVLGLHLHHGIWSFFQTLGLNNSRSNRLWRNLATVVAVVLTIGNVATPVSVLTGIIKA